MNSQFTKDYSNLNKKSVPRDTTTDWPTSVNINDRIPTNENNSKTEQAKQNENEKKKNKNH